MASGDGSLAALLGASPGASTAVTIMLEVLQRCFADKLNSPFWPECAAAVMRCWALMEQPGSRLAVEK